MSGGSGEGEEGWVGTRLKDAARESPDVLTRALKLLSVPVGHSRAERGRKSDLGGSGLRVGGDKH